MAPDGMFDGISLCAFTAVVNTSNCVIKSVTRGGILDEFAKVIGCHRKAAIRLLRRANQPGANKRCGRPRQYGAAVTDALIVAWEATDRLCSKRLHPFLPELIKVLRRYGEGTMTAEIEAQLCRVSPSTIDRLLRPWRRVGGRRAFTATKPGSLLKSAIPIRTFADLAGGSVRLPGGGPGVPLW